MISYTIFTCDIIIIIIIIKIPSVLDMDKFTVEHGVCLFESYIS
jgi:hypothetical protein